MKYYVIKTKTDDGSKSKLVLVKAMSVKQAVRIVKAKVKEKIEYFSIKIHLQIGDVNRYCIDEHYLNEV